MLDRVVVYVAQSIDDLYQQRVHSISCIEEVMNLLEKKCSIEFKVGIGRIHRDKDILISYQEALKALNCDEGGRIVHIDDIAPDIYDIGYEISLQEQKLMISWKTAMYRCLTILSDVFGSIPTSSNRSIHYKIIEMMAAVRRVATENGIRDKPSRDIISKGYYAADPEEFEQVCTEEELACR